MKPLAWTQTRQLNLNLTVGHLPRQPDHVPSQRPNIHRLAHVQHIRCSLARSGQQHQLNCLINRHEITLNVLVGQRDRPTLGDLRLKQWNNRAGRTQHIPKPHNAVPSGSNVHLSNALCRPHHAHRINRLVSRYHHQRLSLRNNRGINHVLRAKYVGLNSLNRIGLHNRNVLQRSSVKHNLRLDRLEYLVNPIGVAHITQQTIGVRQCRAYGIKMVLAVVDEGQRLRVKRVDLSGQLRTNRPTRAGNDHAPLVDQFVNRRQIRNNRPSRKQVLHLNLARPPRQHYATSLICRTISLNWSGSKLQTWSGPGSVLSNEKCFSITDAPDAAAMMLASIPTV